jgi:hypothetical protein
MCEMLANDIQHQGRIQKDQKVTWREQYRLISKQDQKRKKVSAGGCCHSQLPSCARAILVGSVSFVKATLASESNPVLS